MRNKIFSSHTIAGRRYELTKLPIITSGRIAARVGSKLVPAITSISIPDIQSCKDGDIDSIKKALGSLSGVLDKIDPELIFDDAMECIRNGCTVDGIPISQHHDFEKHFSECPQDLFPALIWALKENIGGFFDLAALFQSKKQESDTE
jgi:hypothetical protein